MAELHTTVANITLQLHGFLSIDSCKLGNVFNLSPHLIFKEITLFVLWHFEALHLFAYQYGMWVSIISFWIYFFLSSKEQVTVKHILPPETLEDKVHVQEPHFLLLDGSHSFRKLRVLSVQLIEN